MLPLLPGLCEGFRALSKLRFQTFTADFLPGSPVLFGVLCIFAQHLSQWVVEVVVVMMVEVVVVIVVVWGAQAL